MRKVQSAALMSIGCITLLLLAGCATPFNQGLVKDSNKAVLAINSHDRYVAIAAQCTGLTDGITLSFLPQGAAPYYSTQVIRVQCSLKTPQLILVKLNPGKDNTNVYHLTGLGVSGHRAPPLYAPNFPTYRFTAYPGRVTYIGNLGIKLKTVPAKMLGFIPSHAYTFDLTVSDNYANDIPRFAKKYPNIDQDKYTINILERAPIKK